MTLILVAMALLTVLATPLDVMAQGPRPVEEEDRDQKFVEALRREDAASAEQYIALRDARKRAAGELQEAEAKYRSAGPEFRAVALPQLKKAQRKYAESSLALLDFFEARDRGVLARYQEEIARITRGLAEYERTRADLRKLID